MTKNIYLYSDEGAADLCLFATKEYFKHDNITCVKASQIIQEGIPDDIDLFIMPGGADLPYKRKLNGDGNQAIKHYVEQGGTYLGICAGAYYACQDIEFQKGQDSEICEPRELGFFKGTAVGCLTYITNNIPYDTTLSTATTTNIQTQNQSTPMLYWGSPTFKPAQNTEYDLIATYQDLSDQPPAIISCHAGKGKVILSGIHFEITAQNLIDYDFGNKEENSLKTSLIEKLKTVPPYNKIRVLL